MNTHEQRREPVYSIVDFRPAGELRNVYRDDEGDLGFDHCPGWLVLRHTHDRLKFDDPGRNYNVPREYEVGQFDDVEVVAATVDVGALGRADDVDGYVGTFTTWEIELGRHENT